MKRISFILSLILIINFSLGFFAKIDICEFSDRELNNSENSAEATDVNDTTLYLTENYCTHYFYNLNSNFGANVQGTCGYVAIAMLLSYYDTFFNDNIIDEVYDATTDLSTNKILLSNKSPGISSEKEYISGYGSVGADVYYSDIVLPYSDTYFHLRLIRLGVERGINDITDKNPFGTYNSDEAALIKYYLSSIRGFSSSTITCSSVSRNLLSNPTRDFTIEKVKQGIPVLVSGIKTAYTGDGHAFIVYDYDEANDELYAHMGWYRSSNLTHVKLSTTNYSYLRAATAMDIDSSHSCSNNYVYTDYNGVVTTHCPCELSIHPNHEHLYLDNPIKIDETTHSKCCSKCQETITCSHTYNDRYLYRNTTNHYAYCACGAIKSQGHVITSGGNTCLLCNGRVETGFVVIESNNADYVTENGSYILPNGITVLAEEDVEAYLNGTLQFHARGEVAA